MMMKLRESTAIIMWIVIIAFVGLIVVEWGADYSGGQAARSTDAIGVINGRAISLKSFQEAVRAASQRSIADREERDDGALVRQVWDQLIGEVLVRQELERAGIEISDDEAREAIYGMPYLEWKDKYQEKASDAQMQKFEETKPLHAEISGHN